MEHSGGLVRLMSYQAYERAVGTSVIRSVESYCRHLTLGGKFSQQSTPVLSDVERFIDQTYYELQACLAREGYSVTIPASATAALGWLENMNAVGAVVKMELTRPTTGMRGEPNDRYKQFMKMWEAGTALLASDALGGMGVSRSTELGGFVEVGGVSKSRKRSVNDDTDFVQPRFKRGMFSNPATQAVDPAAEVDTYIR